jgi:hypothetical protein
LVVVISKTASVGGPAIFRCRKDRGPKQVTLLLRRNEFATGRRADYDVIEQLAHDGKRIERVIGRIYDQAGAGQHQWLWAIEGFGSRLADTSEEAMAAFKAAWERRQT